MAESMFDIFGDRLTGSAVKNIPRHPLCNVENMGKMAMGPIKPNEPFRPTGPIKPHESVKKIGELKKSFLSNTGLAFQSTPNSVRKAFTPRNVNVGSLIYTDQEVGQSKNFNIEELEFTKPTYMLDNFNSDVFDFIDKRPEVHIEESLKTPPPVHKTQQLELEQSFDDDDFYNYDYSIESVSDDDLDLPDIF